MKVLALDYGSARTGVAVSDPSGLIARPLATIERVGTEHGRVRLLELIEEEKPAVVVVGMPLTLRGERGEQARETEIFVEWLREAQPVEVDDFDERLTTVIAQRSAAARGTATGADDALAAAHLLESYLEWLRRND